MTKECPFLNGEREVNTNLPNGRPLSATLIEDTKPLKEPHSGRPCVYQFDTKNMNRLGWSKEHVQIKRSLICVACNRHILFHYEGKVQED